MKSIKLIMISLVAGITLVSCLSGSLTPTATLSISETETSTPILSPNKTTTPSLIPTHTPRPTVTWTPLPTIPSNEFSEALLELLNSNNSCDLPCWWGIAPGKTTMSDALHFLARFPFAIGEIRTQRRFYNGEYHNESDFGFRIDIPGKITGTVDIGSTDGTVDSIFVQLKHYRNNYQLDQLLRSLEKPKEIYISAQASSPESELAPTILILNYREKGILAWYEYHTTRIGNSLQFCLQATGTNLSLRNPSFDTYTLPLEKTIEIITGGNSMRLEDATSFTLNSFYDTFVNSTAGKCIETPANLWP